MKKSYLSVLSAIVILCVMLLSACSFFGGGDKDEVASEFVAVDASDLPTEDYGIALPKGNTALATAVNAVIDTWRSDGSLDKYHDYYAAYIEDSNTVPPEGLKTSWNFGTAAATLTMYTFAQGKSSLFTFEKDDLSVSGVDVAILSQVALNMGKKLVIQNVEFPSILNIVANSSGDVVGAASLSITEPRKQLVDFSHIYYSTTLAILSPKDKAYSKVSSLENLRVGVLEDSTSSIIMLDAAKSSGYSYKAINTNGIEETITVKASGATISQFESYEDCYNAIKAGNVDALLLDKIPAQNLADRSN